MVYGIFAVFYGALISVQAAFCADLTAVYGNWFATVVVHLGGLLALTPFFLTKWGRRTGTAPWYLHLGGTIGVANVVFTNYSIVHLGITNSNVLMLLGEILFATVLDSLGLMGARKRRATPMKWAAIAVMLLGTASIALLSGGSGVQFTVLAVGASLLRGAGQVISRHLNGQLGLRCGTGFSTYLNYVTGLAASTLIFLLLGAPMEAAFPAGSVPVWTYLCGAIGCCGIFLCNVAAPKLSALTLSLLGFLSQTLTGMVFDLVSGRLSVPTAIGCAIVTVGMVLNLLAEKQEAAVR